MADERCDIRGDAAVTTFSAEMSAVATSFTIASATGWPDGGTGPFYVVADPPAPDSLTNTRFEKIKCSARSGTSVTVASSGRGSDGTSASLHSSGATVYPCNPAVFADEANFWGSELGAAASGAGRLILADGARSLASLANGTTGHPLVAGAATPAYGQLGTTGVADDAITNDKAANITRGSVKVGGTANAPTDLDAKTSGQILVGDGTDVKSVAVSGDATLSPAGVLSLGTGVVGTDEIATDGVGTAEIAPDAVTSSEVAENAIGLSEAADPVLAHVVSFSRTGVLVTGAGTMRYRFPFAATLAHTRLSVGTAPTGAAILVDVHKNGTTVYTTQGNRPTVAISANAETATTAPDVTAIAAGDYLTVDVDQIGSTIAGADLLVNIYYVLA